MATYAIITDPYVLGVATILGGIAAVWFFWNEIKNTIRGWRTRDEPVGPRPMLAYTVDLREIHGTWAGKPLSFTEVVLVIENRGELIAENHVPDLVIEDGGTPLFDNREALTQGSVAGEIPPNTSVIFSMYRLLRQPISKICDLILLRGLYAILDRDLTAKLHSTYTSPGGSRVYDSAVFEVKFHWFFDKDNCDRVSAAIDNVSYTRYRAFHENKAKTKIVNAVKKYGQFIVPIKTTLRQAGNIMSRQFTQICAFKRAMRAWVEIESGQTRQILVMQVLSNSQATQIGLQSGDIIDRYDGERIIQLSSLVSAIQRPGDSPRELIILRDGQTFQFEVVPGLLGVELRETVANAAAAPEASREIITKLNPPSHKP